jgi:hypothetical protein
MKICECKILYKHDMIEIISIPQENEMRNIIIKKTRNIIFKYYTFAVNYLRYIP